NTVAATTTTCRATRHRPPPDSWYNIYASELLVNSNWDRHEFTANLRGTYASYDPLPSQDRPNVDSRVNARIDVMRWTQLLLEGRYLLFTDYPGSPNIQAGLAHLPLAMTYGSTVGVGQQFNHLDVTVKTTFDRTVYDDSTSSTARLTATPAATSTNTARNCVRATR